MERNAAIVEAYRSGRASPEIAREWGLSRQMVVRIVNRELDASERARIREDRTWVRGRCGTCGKACRVRRKVAGRKMYCGSECYMAAIGRPEYQQHRQSQRVARGLVERVWRPLEMGWVVHHEDGDPLNNDVSNLVVFASQGDHMRWHRGGGEESGVVPLWRGADPS